jgi:hypothetical protein
MRFSIGSLICSGDGYPHTHLKSNGGSGNAHGIPAYNYCGNKSAVVFVKSRQVDAQALADKLRVPSEFVLAVPAEVSQYGSYPTAVAANNYFGIHAGKVATANGST